MFMIVNSIDLTRRASFGYRELHGDCMKEDSSYRVMVSLMVLDPGYLSGSMFNGTASKLVFVRS